MNIFWKPNTFFETKKPETINQKPKTKHLKPFLFSNKGIPSTPQHTISTPAPDRGGPVACLGGSALASFFELNGETNLRSQFFLGANQKCYTFGY